MRFAWIAGLLVIAFAAAAPAAAAELAPACEADAQRLCPHDAAGSVRQIQCVKKHQASLLPDCKKAIAAQAKTAAAVCQADIAKFCPTVQPGVGPGVGRIAKCLMPHRNELSPRCKAAAANL